MSSNGNGDCDVCRGAHSITSAHVDLGFDNNATWADAFQFGDPTDFTWTLTGQAFSMAVQLTHYDAVPLLLLKSATGQIIIVDVIQRVIQLNVPDTAVQAVLKPGEYVYDLVMADGSSPPIRTPLMHGRLCLSQGVTMA